LLGWADPVVAVLDEIGQHPLGRIGGPTLIESTAVRASNETATSSLSMQQSLVFACS